jgi:prepilin-type N-terminal cleavage/methylation domain-containing protein
MKKRFFTLIELMIVIVIIAILIGLLLPVIQTVKDQAKKTQARSQMNAIITAIRTYESTYGILPLPDLWADKNVTNKYDDLMALLTDVAGPSTEASYTAGNARNIRFLDVPTNYSTLGFLDPWGSKYLIYVDSGYAGTVVVNPGSGYETLYGTVFIYSTAGTTTPSKYVYSWK